ncbi:PD40 domain-containing protein [Candidatus Sumerlaeota bacterium]|nr:PD40 domain-containing protein [Candidatus Sumerlaeota bacterium]
MNKFATLLIFSLWLFCAFSFAQDASETGSPADRLPKIHPDYSDVVIPPNIAPLNFYIDEAGDSYHVKIHSQTGDPIEIHSNQPSIEIPLGQWKGLLSANRGQKLYIDIAITDTANNQRRFKTIENEIANDEIDPFLAYRKLNLCLIWRDMGLFQRNLENFDETIVLHNYSYNYGCANCHTFYNNDPRHMTLQVRSTLYGTPMLLVDGDEVEPKAVKGEATSGKANFVAWHPNGEIIAVSDNKFSMMIHTTGQECRDVFDAAGDVDLYFVKTGKVVSESQISQPDRIETFPEWSRDGKYLYFCSAPQLPLDRYAEVIYDLMRIAYNVESGEWGELETVLTSEEVKGSVVQPRFSPDGRFLLFNAAQYSDFPVDKAKSDLHMLDVETGGHRKLSISSERNDSWHSWSSNSRWIAFSSRRIDGRFTRPFFSYVDENGEAHKPFVLPQQDPAYYDSLTRAIQVPELITGPIPVKGRQFIKAMKDNKKRALSGDSPWKSSKESVSDTPAANRNFQ